MNNKILATITTYNPDVKLLESNIDSIVGQVDKLIVYENNSRNRNDIIELCANKNIEIILNDKNYGVSVPLYDGVEYADSHQFQYILTLDQDTISSEGMVAQMLKLLQSDEKLAMVGPTFLNPDIGISEGIDKDTYVTEIITSGALADVKIIKKVGNYLKELFIDAVDNEICYRLRKHGYSIARSKVTILHRMGEPEVHKFLFKTFRTRNYSPIRYYYTWRNSHFLFRIYKKDKKAIKGLKYYLFRTKVKIILAEKDKKTKLAAIRKGKKDSKTFYEEMKNKYPNLL